MKLILYSGKDCHLCELAKNVLSQINRENNLEVEIFDIKSSHELYHLYAVRIPVLKRPDNQMELGWPFDSNQLRAFIQ